MLTNRLAACPTARQCQDGCNSTSTVLICQMQKGHNTPCQTSKAFGVAAWQSVDLSSGSLASCTTEVSEFNAGEGSPEIQAAPVLPDLQDDRIASWRRHLLWGSLFCLHACDIQQNSAAQEQSEQYAACRLNFERACLC